MRLPVQHVEDAWSACEFYANKVLAEWRAKDAAHAAWVGAVKELTAALKAYCSRCHATGPAWNAAGMELADYTPGAAPAAPAPPAPAAAAPQKRGPAPPPPPPPPPPPGSLIERRPAAAAAGANGSNGSANGGGGAMAALLADISKGAAVTSGLRKVTDDMKTKNRAPTERTGAVPSTDKPAARAAPAAAAKAPTAPPRTECEQGRKWVVENHVDNAEIVIADTQPKQTVYIFNCRRCTVQVCCSPNAAAS